MKRDGGQATVELVLVLPVLAVILLAVVQLAVLIADQVRVVDAAREAARAAAVGEAAGPVAAAAGDGLAPDRLDVGVARAGGVVTATVRYRAPTAVPLVGGWCPTVFLTARTTMRNETPEAEQPP